MKFTALKKVSCTNLLMTNHYVKKLIKIHCKIVVRTFIRATVPYLPKHKMTFAQNLQFSGQYVHSTCRIWCAIIS
jgi:hypothetical protein